MSSRPYSQGSVGEQLAEQWFRENGWIMVRTQPETRVVYLNKPTVINCRGGGGVADYTGYECVQIGPTKYPLYRAVEVKEVRGNTMPASRLEKDQRDWMAKIDPRCAFVGICWADNPIAFELFKFIPKGSFKKGCGTGFTRY
jgi:hypothetical protein